MKEKIIKYYKNNFDKICDIDELTANRLFLIYGYDLNERCNSNKSLFYNLNNKYYNFFNPNQYVVDKEIYYYITGMFYNKSCVADMNIIDGNNAVFNIGCNETSDCVDFLNEHKEKVLIYRDCSLNNATCIKEVKDKKSIKDVKLSNVECV